MKEKEETNPEKKTVSWETIIDGSFTSEKEKEETGTISIQEKNQTGKIQAKSRINEKSKKLSFEEYKKRFLETPKIEDRKTVFISGILRDKLDEIARKMGDRKMSVSGFIENLVRHHLEMYEDEITFWKKL